MCREDVQNRLDRTGFAELLKQKKRFIIPTTLFFLLFYYLLPILAAYTDLLHEKAIGPINWAYLYAFAQFAMTWIITLVYLYKAGKFDQLSEQVEQRLLAADEKQV